MAALVHTNTNTRGIFDAIKHFLSMILNLIPIFVLYLNVTENEITMIIRNIINFTAAQVTGRLCSSECC